MSEEEKIFKIRLGGSIGIAGWCIGAAYMLAHNVDLGEMWIAWVVLLGILLMAD